MTTRTAPARAGLALVVALVLTALAPVAAAARAPQRPVPPAPGRAGPPTTPPTTAPPTTPPTTVPPTVPPTTTPTVPPTTPPTTTPPTTSPPPTTPAGPPPTAPAPTLPPLPPGPLPPPPTDLPPASPTPPDLPPGPVGPATIDAPVTSGGVPAGVTDGIDPGLAAVLVSGPAVEAADAAVRRAEAAAERAVAAQRRGAAEVAAIAAEQRRVRRRLDDLSAEERANADALVQERRRLQHLAVAAYVGGGDDTVAAVLLASPDAYEYERRGVYVDLADERVEDRISAYRAARDAAAAGVAEAVAELAALDARAESARAVVTEAKAAEAAWRAVAAERAEERAAATAMSWVVGADFRLVLDAYWRAARDAGEVGCSVPWSALAGIGRVESGHGTHGGSTVDEAGAVAPPIIGIPLTGANGTAQITDSDGGHYDGDVVNDRAVGPMQFIPSTWRGYGRDGDGDGTTDPQNLYDAAAAAAAYVCQAAGGDLTTDAGRTRAYLAYNHSAVYASTVLGYATAYAELGLPVGAEPA